MAVVRYLVNDIQPAVEFYTRHLGFSLEEEWGPVTILSKGDLELWVSGPASSAGQTKILGAKPSPGGSNRIVFPVKDLDATLKKLAAAGVRTCSDTIDGPAGRWTLIADPAGNPIELFEAK
jgi:predicted enzyme related to lactoylglutathione lyase